MWKGAKGEHEYLINVIWPLTPFTADNGATQIYPYSHGRDGMEKEDVGDPIAAICDPGSAICFLGSTAHGAGPNLTQSVRRGVVIGYSLGWLKRSEEHTSELQSLMRISYAVFCLTKKNSLHHHYM